MHRREFIKLGLAASAVTSLGFEPHQIASAQGRDGTLRVLAEGVANSLDSMATGNNREALSLAWNVYDRLLTFDRAPFPGGGFVSEYFKLKPQLAESWTVSEGGKQITFRIRKGAKFHDGSPVTADDVKWSLDRAVAMPTTKNIYNTGLMSSADQFVIVDSHTVRIDLPRGNTKVLPLLGFVYTAVYNSKLARQHATAEDPFAATWLKLNTAAGGAYKITAYDPAKEVVLERNDDWLGGDKPFFQRIIHRLSQEPSSRIAGIVRGSADVATYIPPKDMEALTPNRDLQLLSIPMSNAFHFLGMNSQMAPFDNPKVRRAVAYAIPYDDLFKGVMFGRGKLLTSNPQVVGKLQFPPAQDYKTDIEKARALLAEAGFPNGFETTFTYNSGDTIYAEPSAVLIQESLARIGIRIAINKVPNSQYGQLMVEKKVPFFYEISATLLLDPDYGFQIFYAGNTRFNFGSLKSDEMVSLIDQASKETDKAKYDGMVKRMIQIASDEVPMIMLWNPAIDSPLRRDIEGYTYMFHRGIDYRTLRRA
jgi:peptide/nickel transport system substrate-binding protein